MHLVFAHDGERSDLDVRFERSSATIGELLLVLEDRLGIQPGASGLFVDGLFRHSDTDVDECGLHEGSVVALTSAGAGAVAATAVGALPDDAQLAVLILSGMHAGRVVPLPVDGEYQVGRDPSCHVHIADPTVSRLHCTLQVGTVGTVTVVNHSSTSGTRVAGRSITDPQAVAFGTPVLLGNTTIVVDRLDLSDRLVGFELGGWMSGPAGTVSLNRPPRVAAEHPETVLDPPVEPTDSGRPPFNVASVVAPAALGVVMVIAMHNLFWALFALVSPVMVVGNWWETRHRSVRALRSSTRAYARDLARFEQAVSEGRQREEEQRRASVPNLAEVAVRAGLPSVSLWERRRFHDDFLSLSLGYSDLEWKPKLTSERRRPLGGDVAAILGRHRTLFDVPVTADLDGGGVIGVTGPRDLAVAVARGLACQAAVLHGPADLRMVFMVPAGDLPEWEWAKWLPHTRDQTGGSERHLVAAGEEPTAELLSSLTGGPTGGSPAQADPSGPATMYLIDGPEVLAGRAAPARRLLSGQLGRATGVVIAPSVEQLPAICSEVIALSESGEATLTRPRHGRGALAVRPGGLTAADAEAVSVRLARFDDPELHTAGAGLPPVVHLGTLLGVERWDPDAVAARWRRHDAMRSLRAAIGSEESGAFELDLDRHGPHGLIGGTTGSGKSELLKTIVASLAATYPPDQLTFGLFDFKGGSTFTDLASLPHTVGTASDLDVNLARRALRCLRAELLHRERVFDRAGAADLFDLEERRRRGDPAALAVEALPRLVVIIDEFAAMAKELAEEIGAIADLTARGRSLGVHLLLATQKPSSSVNAEVRTNTRLRISLKVEDRQDSVDVVGIPDAASIDHKGRGYFRVGQGEVLPIQSALSSGPAVEGGAPAVTVSPFSFHPHPAPDPAPVGAGTTELEELVAALRSAFSATGLASPRRPWPDPLPDALSLERLAAMPASSHADDPDLVFALADDPERQTRYPVGWSFRDGNLLLYGVVGSGATTALASLGVQFARGGPPDARHLYVISAAGELSELGGLAHCAGVVRVGDRDLQVRLLRRLADELARRRRDRSAAPGSQPTILLLVDNLEALHAALEENHDSAFWEQFVRIYADGPPVGIYTAAAVTRIGGAPSAISTATPTKLLFRLADLVDYGALGVSRTQLPTFAPGRAVMVGSGLAVQTAAPTPSLAAEVAATVATSREAGGPDRLEALADVVPMVSLAGLSVTGTERWDLAIGMRDRDLSPAVLTLYEGEHAIVAGRARSGRSTTLLAVAASFLDANPTAAVYGIASRRSPLPGSRLVSRCATTLDDAATVCNLAQMATAPTLLVIDDAERVDDPDGRLAALVSDATAAVHVVAGVNADALRGSFGHWTSALRRSRAGLLLQPSLDRDGDLLGASLPYRVHVAMPPGRGFLVCGGQAELVQVATPSAG